MHALRSKMQSTTSARLRTRTAIRVLRTMHTSAMHMCMWTVLSIGVIIFGHSLVQYLIISVTTPSKSSRASKRGRNVGVGPLRLLTISISPQQSRETLTEDNHKHKVAIRQKDIEFGRQREDKQTAAKTVRMRQANEAYFEKRSTACAHAESFALSWHQDLYRNKAEYATPEMNFFL
jgi:hypothetical protein